MMWFLEVVNMYYFFILNFLRYVFDGNVNELNLCILVLFVIFVLFMVGCLRCENYYVVSSGVFGDWYYKN